MKPPSMLARFSLYGFLRTQQYFDPFLVLIFLEKGLSFTAIGLLIAFREATVFVLEIPSGALADLFGRRKVLLTALGAYVVSFITFGCAQHLGILLAAMFLFGTGEAMRSGTHKAMILAWLKEQNRTDERTKFYGYTRSWSKFGAAISAMLAAALVFFTDSYAYVFYASAAVYVLAALNVWSYPSYLDGQKVERFSLKAVYHHLKVVLLRTLRKGHLRTLLQEAMGFEGVFRSVKDFLQPILQAAAAGMTVSLLAYEGLTTVQQSCLLVGPVYLLLHFLSGIASRLAHRVTALCGGEERTARWLWGLTLVLFLAITLAGYFQLSAVLIVAFVVLHILQNLWRPVMVSRIGGHSSTDDNATVLSLESQGRRIVTMAATPLHGLAIDTVIKHELGGPFWPLGVAGSVVAAWFLIRRAKPLPAT